MKGLGTLRGRLAILYAGLAAAMLVVVYLAAGAALENALIENAAARLEIEAGLVVADATGKRLPTATDLAAGDLAAVLGGYGTAVAIVDGEGRVLASERNGATDDVLEARLDASAYAKVIASGEAVHAVWAGVDGHRALVVASPVQLRVAGQPGSGNGNGNGNGNSNGNGNGSLVVDASPNAVAQLAISLDSLDATVAGVQSTLQLAAVFALVAVAIGVWLVTRYALRPLDKVALAADRISAGDLGARAALPNGDDEVGRLGRAFDGMAERLDATLRAQRAFAVDASHELRSPLTVLGGYVDILARGEAEGTMEARTLAAMRRELDRVARLSADLLLITHLEAGGGRLEPRPMDLRLLAQEIGSAAVAMAPDRTIEIRASEPLPVVADPDRLTQAVMNLVDNAIRHAPPGGTLRITAARASNEAEISVANDGAPIPEADLPRVFDRFFRSTTGSDSSKGQHTGLGLAIVKAIVEASNGTVVAISDVHETRFSIRLPIAS